MQKNKKSLTFFLKKSFSFHSNSRFLSSFIEILIISTIIIMFFKKRSFRKRVKSVVAIVELTRVFVDEYQKRARRKKRLNYFRQLKVQKTEKKVQIKNLF